MERIDSATLTGELSPTSRKADIGYCDNPRPANVRLGRPSTSRQCSQCRKCHDETGRFTDCELLTKNKYPEQGGDHETHLGDRHQHSGLTNRYTAKQENSRTNQNYRSGTTVF